jgi:phospholipid transport system substrate-binding protein
MRIMMNPLCRAGFGCRSVLTAVLAGVFLVMVSPLPAISGPTTPKLLVEQFHDTLLGVMKDAKKLGYQGRMTALTPEIARAFHLPVMTRIVAGRHWKKFSRPQKLALVDAFSRMTTATYAHRFKGYGGERFLMVKAVDVRKKAVMIKTELVKTDGSAVKLDYLVKRFKKGWRVVDIYLDGAFSELATRRSEYSSVLGRKGLDALIGQINKKVAQYAAEDKPR